MTVSKVRWMSSLGWRCTKPGFNAECIYRA